MKYQFYSFDDARRFFYLVGACSGVTHTWQDRMTVTVNGGSSEVSNLARQFTGRKVQ